AQVCPGISIHAIDIVQLPDIGIPPIADIHVHQTIVPAALTAKSSADIPKKARLDARSETMRLEISSSRVAAMTATPSHPRWVAFLRAGAARFRKAASPASDTSTHFESGEASAS